MNELKNAEASKAYKVKIRDRRSTAYCGSFEGQDRPHHRKGGPGRQTVRLRHRKGDCAGDKKQYGFDIDKRKIHLDTDIKAFGGYHIEVKLYNGITAKLAVSVTEAQ